MVRAGVKAVLDPLQGLGLRLAHPDPARFTAL